MILDMRRTFFPFPKALLVDLFALACMGLDDEERAAKALARWAWRLAKEGKLPWAKA